MVTWSPEIVNELASLWRQGMPTRKIGERLGCGKNAVIGKAHKLGLPGRPSPIKRRDPSDTTPPRRVRRSTAAKRSAVEPAGPTEPPLPAPENGKVYAPFLAIKAWAEYHDAWFDGSTQSIEALNRFRLALGKLPPVVVDHT